MRDSFVFYRSFAEAIKKFTYFDTQILKNNPRKVKSNNTSKTKKPGIHYQDGG